MNLAHMCKVYTESMEMVDHSEMYKFIGARLGGEFITHKYIPDEYEGNGYYGGIAFDDRSLLLLPTRGGGKPVLVLVRNDKYEVEVHNGHKVVLPPTGETSCI